MSHDPYFQHRFRLVKIALVVALLSRVWKLAVIYCYLHLKEISFPFRHGAESFIKLTFDAIFTIFQVLNYFSSFPWKIQFNSFVNTAGILHKLRAQNNKCCLWIIAVQHMFRTLLQHNVFTWTVCENMFIVMNGK